MVTNPRIGAATSETVKKTIQSIKEIVKNHSDADIYVALKEANMDPNETTHKLLNQDSFHEVKRRRDRNKESVGYKGVEPSKHAENVVQGMKFCSENVVQGMKFRAYPGRGARRGGYTRNPLRGSGISREFRVVRDNRHNQSANKESEPPLLQSTTSTSELVVVNGTKNGSVAGGSRSSSQASDALSNSLPRHAQDANVNGTIRKEVLDGKQTVVSNASSWSQAVKPNNFQSTSATQSSSGSVVGVYSSSTDPVHVPSPESRSSGAVGAIKREVGVVGVCRQPFQNAVEDSSVSSSSLSNSHLGRDNSLESFRHFPTISKADQLGHSTSAGSIMPSISGNRSFLSNQYGNRPHQQVVGHQKATQNKIEWKPKSNKKSSTNNPGVIGTPKKSASPPVNDVKDLESETGKLQDKLSQVNVYENENVIIADHIRVPENDRCQLAFGSFGVELDSSRSYGPGFQAIGVAEVTSGESSSSDDASGSKPVDGPADQVRNSGSGSPASGAASEHHLPDKRDSTSPQNSDNYADIGLVEDNSQSYVPPEPHQPEDPPELPNFSAYDPQTGYDIPYFRPTMDDSTGGQGLPSPQEVLNSYSANSIPASTLAIVQQQSPVAQMYPQVHVSHFANLMPYRQFLSPVFVPQMAMPGYASSPPYAHPSNGSSYLLMPGGSSLKYGIQQFKPVPAGNPTGFGTFTSPTGYAINAPGVVGNANGLEDSSRIKYIECDIYAPNQQVDGSDLWIQNPRELQGMQSAAYYSMAGQTPHGAYLPSHTGHASFHAAAAQSSHVQFPGMYHPPSQPAAMPNPHHPSPAMGANVGVGVAPAAPGAQVGAYQQPQLGHLNWTANF